MQVARIASLLALHTPEQRQAIAEFFLSSGYYGYQDVENYTKDADLSAPVPIFGVLDVGSLNYKQRMNVLMTMSLMVFYRMKEPMDDDEYIKMFTVCLGVPSDVASDMVKRAKAQGIAGIDELVEKFLKTLAGKGDPVESTELMAGSPTRLLQKSSAECGGPAWGDLLKLIKGAGPAATKFLGWLGVVAQVVQVSGLGTLISRLFGSRKALTQISIWDKLGEQAQMLVDQVLASLDEATFETTASTMITNSQKALSGDPLSDVEIGGLISGLKKVGKAAKKAVSKVGKIAGTVGLAVLSSTVPGAGLAINATKGLAHGVSDAIGGAGKAASGIKSAASLSFSNTLGPMMKVTDPSGITAELPILSAIKAGQDVDSVYETVWKDPGFRAKQAKMMQSDLSLPVV